MLRSYVGYCGGTKEHPSYRSLGDHTEAFSIDFDPTVLSYDELLQRFWNGHHCGTNVGARQYMNAIFYQNEAQQKLAETSREEAASKADLSVQEVKTLLLPVGTFTFAEAYHQKYSLTRHHELRAFLNETYPTGKQLAESTVATRLNAWLGDGIDRRIDVLRAELPSYGLPEGLQNYVLGALGA